MKNILFVTSEARPFAASGGLGDVAGSLPAAVKRAGGDDVDIRVVMPLYASVSQEYRSKMLFKCKFEVPLAWRRQYCGVFELQHEGVTWYFIDNEYYFKRAELYGSYDDGERYAYFCRAVLEMLGYVGFAPDVLHANDWQTAMCVIYHKCKGYYPSMRCIYTIHNIEYQGKYGFEILGDVFDLPKSDMSLVSFDGCINLTKGAIVACDALTTVSPQYAKELTAEYFGAGLHNMIAQNSYKLSGILNGIDYGYYDPANDSELEFTFDQKKTSGKAKNKTALQAELGLPQRAEVPMIGIISRLVGHKGIDLIRRVADEILTSDVQMVILGTGDPAYEDFFRGLAAAYPDKVSTNIMFNRVTAKKIYASSDVFLMPSKTEPCGLAQMIACRYGTVPVVRETGGLFDSIKAFNPVTGEGNGVTFSTYNAHDMLDAVRRALAMYADKPLWRKLRKNAMTSDFSWDSSARRYLELYNSL